MRDRLYSMAKKKSGGANKLPNKSKAKKKKAARKTKVTASLKPSSRKKIAGKKVRSAAKKRPSSQRAAKETRSAERSTLAGGTFPVPARHSRSGIRAASAGQSGDLQGLSRKQGVDSESVEELLEEGQTHEAEAVSGVENALEPDQGEVQTHEVLEDDVPEEYTDED
jgi:hypothetical protein